MHVPWLQVATEIVELVAPDLATLLRWREDSAGWGLLKMFKWALGRCPDDAPPSANDVIEGPEAARLIARAAGWRKDPEAFVDACEAVQPAVLERLPGGIRIRGLDRYDSVWGKNRPEEWKLWKAQLEDERKSAATPVGAPSGPARSSAESGTEPVRNRNVTESKPVLQTQTQTQTQTQIQKEEDARPSAPVDPVRAMSSTPLRVDARPDRRAPLALDGRMDAVWARLRRTQHRWTRSEQEAIRGVIDASEGDDDRAMRVWEAALRRTKFPVCNGVADLVRGWNTYEQDATPPRPELREVGPDEDPYAEGAA